MVQNVKLHDLVRVLNQFGFVNVSNGRHMKFRNSAGRSVPVPYNRIMRGVYVKDIIKQAGLNKEEFLAAL